LGGVPVNVPVGDVYSGLQRGSLDCAANDPSGIIAGFRWGEIADNITMMPLGLVLGGALFSYNTDFWKSLSTDHRSLLMDEMALATARMLVEYQSDTQANVEGGRAAGATVVDPEPSFIAARDAFNEVYLQTIVEEAMSSRRLEDPTPVLDEFFALERKWAELLDTVDRSDADAMASLIRAEIYDKVDVEAYGTH
ncbi:MAG: TRAP transporter substrate-binding protein DctP, partial [Paracoccaceae bacterium]